MSTNPYVRRASSSSSIEYANAGHAVRNAVKRNTITLEIRTPIEYRPVSAAPEIVVRKSRSMKLIAQSASPDGTSGIPNRFISRNSARLNSRPSW